MKYRESVLSKQLYELNKDRLIKLYNPIINPNKTKSDLVYCFSWYIKKFIAKILRASIIDEENHLSLEEMSNTDKVVDIDLQHIPRIAVYTCVLGGYDKLWEPLYRSSYCDYYAITDFDIDSESIWNRIEYEKFIPHVENKTNFTYINRWCKMHPHNIFPQYEYSVYIDGSVLIVADIVPLVLKMIKSGSFIGIHKHGIRKYIKTEAKAIVKTKKNIDRKTLYNQIHKYKSRGYNDDIPLLEATIIVRKHNHNKCIKVMEDWWDEFIKYSPRDQISLPYVLWKNGMTIDDIYILGNDEHFNPRFVINGHNR
ncbi:glycosyltransferase domain-containing protein [Selenomonas ruminis]|nr:glycosyltransferase domain-containing protein [Selenomonas sp. mPRGC5]